MFTALLFAGLAVLCIVAGLVLIRQRRAYYDADDDESFDDEPSASIALRDVISRNADEGVTWVHSYVSSDHRKTYCVYDAPSPEAIRRVAGRNQFPVDHIAEVQVLDPYFYR